MDFGVVVSSSLSVSQLIDAATAAERSALDFFLITDHYLHPTTNVSVDSWTVLSAIAARTEKIRIGTCVTPIPFRPPPMLAKVVATVDQISNGRAILGVGAGWHKPEFDAYSAWDEDRVRVAKTVEGIGLIRRFWTSDSTFDFHGRYYEVSGAILEAKPVQKPHPPLWFGGTGIRMLKAARKYGRAWVPPVPPITLDAYRSVLSALKGSSVKVRFNGTLDELSKNIENFITMGCDGAILSRVPYQELPTAMERLAKEVASSYR